VGVGGGGGRGAALEEVRWVIDGGGDRGWGGAWDALEADTGARATLSIIDGYIGDDVDSSSAWMSLNSSHIDLSNDLDVDARNTSYPYPGTQSWDEYASAHRTLYNFVQYSIPCLSGDVTSLQQGRSLRDLFAPDAQMKTFDGSILGHGPVPSQR